MKNDTQTHAANPADNATAQHTPEPWEAAEAVNIDDPALPYICIFSLSDAEIAPARAYGDTPEQLAANARLIVESVNSAPRLKSERDSAQAHFKLAHEELTKLREVNAELVGLLRIAETYVVAGAESTPYHAEHNTFLSDLRTAIARIEKGGVS